VDVRKELHRLEESMALGGDTQGANVAAAARLRIDELDSAFTRITGVAEDLADMLKDSRNINMALWNALRERGMTEEELIELKRAAA
jgi:hypothetical protein